MRRAFMWCGVLALVSCAEPSAPPEPPAGPVWKYGPGCTLYWTFALSDSTYEIVVEHVDRCPRVVLDSTLVTP